jgi:uncharacterized membrane protein YkvI
VRSTKLPQDCASWHWFLNCLNFIIIIIIIIIIVAVFCHHRFRLQETCAMNFTFFGIRSQLERVNFCSLVILCISPHLLSVINKQTDRHCNKLSISHNSGLQFQPFALNSHRTKLLHFLKHFSYFQAS